MMGLLDWLFGGGGISSHTSVVKSTLQVDDSIQATDADIKQLEDSLLANEVGVYTKQTAGDDLNYGTVGIRDSGHINGDGNTVSKVYDFFPQGVQDMITNMINQFTDFANKSLQTHTDKDLLTAQPGRDSVFESKAVQNSNVPVYAAVGLVAAYMIFQRTGRKK